jgi:hypothetical protein
LLGHPYIEILNIDFARFGHGYERLPFQTRLLLAPRFRWAQESPLMLHDASRWSSGNYAVTTIWGLLVETRIFGELLPSLA